MLRNTILASTVVIASVGISACSPAEDRPALSEHNSEAPAPDPNKEDPSLKIEHPKNLKSVADPCTLLSPEQMTNLGQDAKGKHVDTTYGTPACDWAGDNFAVTVTPITTIGRDAKRMYQDAKNNGQPQRYKVGEYPAATLVKQPVNGTVEVAVAADQSFTVLFSNYSNGNPAMDDTVGYAKKIAAEVLKNIPDA